MKKGFTLIEMILVLTVISLIMLLTIPNIAKKKQVISSIGCRALIEVVNGQILVYELSNDNEVPTIDQLVSEGLITQQQTVCPTGNRIVIKNGQAVEQ